MIKLYCGDCLEVMKTLADGSVDMVLCDLPYGTTACKWDIIIPFEPLWRQYNRVVKENGAIVLFGNQPFTSELIHSNLNGYKYCWTWDKKIPSGFTYAKYRPMQQTEDIVVFSRNGGKVRYNPQYTKRDKPIKAGGNKVKPRCYHDVKSIGTKEYKREYEYKNPTTLISFGKIRKGALHPTQKPVELLEYLIKTYTDEGDLVLDNCMGSGSTGVACKNLNRDFVGIELDRKYYEIAKERIYGTDRETDKYG